MLFSTAHILPALLLAQSVFSATPDEWRGKSIYQVRSMELSEDIKLDEFPGGSL